MFVDEKKSCGSRWKHYVPQQKTKSTVQYLIRSINVQFSREILGVHHVRDNEVLVLVLYNVVVVE